MRQKSFCGHSEWPLIVVIKYRDILLANVLYQKRCSIHLFSICDAYIKNGCRKNMENICNI